MADELRRSLATETARSLPGIVAVATGPTGPLFEGATGSARVGENAPLHLDSLLAIQSATKPLVAAAALQAVEDGEIDLDAPARKYAPELGELRVLTGFASDRGLLLREPVREVTVRMLMLHTSGFAYDMFNEDYRELVGRGAAVPASAGRRESLDVPLVFEPGTRWEYGLGIDWLGVILERVEGARLDEVVRRRVLEPLGMSDTGFSPAERLVQRFASVHVREDNGSLRATGMLRPKDRAMDMGGTGMYSTAPDYAKFVAAWLNDGEGEFGRFLTADTIAMASENGLGRLKVGPLPSFEPNLARPFDFLYPETTKSWALSFMITDGPTVSGRSPGTLSWTGLANTYFWIDRSARIGGVWACNLLPLGEHAAWSAYLDFESAVYSTFAPGR